MRVEERISGVRATLALKLYGEDLAELDRISGELKNVFATVPGVADLSLEANLGKPQIRIKVDRAEMARHGMTAQTVHPMVRTRLGGRSQERTSELQSLISMSSAVSCLQTKPRISYSLHY